MVNAHGERLRQCTSGVFIKLSSKLRIELPSHPVFSANAIFILEGHLSQFFKPVRGIQPVRCTGIIKNVAYTLQYLEFLTQIDDDLNLSAVLTTQNHKAFVIHGCAVVEAIFYYALVTSGRAPHTDWISQAKITSSEFNLAGRVFRQETEYFVKVPKPMLESMTFDAMCKRVESKKVIRLDNAFYSKLPYLRGLRNRVHIYGIENTADTDYIKFNRKDYELMKSILKAIMTSHLFADQDEQLDLRFLDPSS